MAGSLLLPCVETCKKKIFNFAFSDASSAINWALLFAISPTNDTTTVLIPIRGANTQDKPTQVFSLIRLISSPLYLNLPPFIYGYQTMQFLWQADVCIEIHNLQLSAFLTTLYPQVSS